MIPCYVIHLGDTFKNKQSLLNVGLDPVGFRGVDGKKDEYLYHIDRLNPVCQYTCPKTVIGCGLSHILLAEKLSNEGVQIALVLEDDAYPLKTSIDFAEIFRSAPPDWEMIKLHCDMYCRNGSSDTPLSASAGAYIVNEKGMTKLKNMKLFTHVDIQFNVEKLKMYKTKHNIFRTDESKSINRTDGTDEHWLSVYLPRPTSGEKVPAQLLDYKLLRIPGTDVEFNVGEVVNFFIFAFILFILYMYKR